MSPHDKKLNDNEDQDDESDVFIDDNNCKGNMQGKAIFTADGDEDENNDDLQISSSFQVSENLSQDDKENDNDSTKKQRKQKIMIKRLHHHQITNTLWK